MMFRTLLRRLAPWLLPALVHAQGVDLVQPGFGWQWLPGRSEASLPDPAAWRNPGFPTPGWNGAFLPLYYGEPLDGTLIPDMRGAYSSVFVRRTFTVKNPGEFADLILRVAADDGFVAWINGHEVARLNVPDGDLPFDAFALSAAPEPVALEDYPVARPATVLREGENVLAVHMFNTTLNSSDLVFDARLVGVVDTTPPSLVRRIPVPGAIVRSLDSVEVEFSEAVAGLEAADLEFNGVAATEVREFAPGQFLFTPPALGPGPVAVAFRPDHGITDRSGAALPFAGAAWDYRIDPDAPEPGLQINEFLADNVRGLRDDDGDRSDWIELYNGSDSAVNLEGWSLTDDPEQPRRWVFPPLVLMPGNYLLVFASGKDRTNNLAPLHTNFRLSADGEALALHDPEGAVHSGFLPSYPPQRGDVAFGRAVGAPSVTGFFPEPTPGGENTVGGPGFAPNVTFSVGGGTYQGTLQVTLGLDTDTPPPGAVIRYTTDGTLPTEASAAYSEPLTFDNQAVRLRARAFAADLFPGRPRTESYVPLSAFAAGFTSDLPVLVIHDFGAGRPPANSAVFADFQVYEPDTNGLTRLTGPPALATRSTIRARGSSTEGYPKVSLRVEFQDEFGNDADRRILGMPAEADWVLYAPNNFEPVLIHNPFMHQLSRDIGRYSPRARMVEVFLVTSASGAVTQSTYNGIYVLMERIEIDGDRADLGRLTPQDLTAPGVTGGYLMKIDRLDPGDSGLSAGGMTVGLVEPSEAELEDPARSPQRNYLRNYLNAFASALNGPNYRDPAAGYRAFVDVDSWVDHHLLNVLAFNVDALRLSAYFGKRKEGLLEFGPLWDFDRALGSTDGRDANPRTWRSTAGDLGTDFFNFPWWGRLFTDPDFYQRYIDRYQALRRGAFGTAELHRLTDELADAVRRAQPREQARWGIQPRGGSYQSEVDLMKNWLANRTDFMDSQFVAPPRLVTPGGTVDPGHLVRFEVPAGVTVHYTLDGSDPRLPGGNLSPAARLYSGPFAVTTNTRVRARSRNPGHTARTGPNNPPLVSIWSGEVSDAFITDPTPLRLTEIHFHPQPTPDIDSDDQEFVEITNVGTREVDLEGLRLTGGVEFLFQSTNSLRRLPPGGRLVLVENPVAFAQRYPDVDVVAGRFSGRLDNAGETLDLLGPLGEVIVTVPYRPDWAPSADGGGDSLVPVDEQAPPEAFATAAAWTASGVPGGSPGLPDPGPTGPAASIAIAPDGTLRLSFEAVAGRTHVVERRADLWVGDWIPLRTLPAATTSGTVEIEVTPEGSHQFLRVRRL